MTWKACTQPTHLVKGGHGVWHSPAGFFGYRPVRLQHFHAHSPGFRVGIHEVYRLCYHTFSHDGIGIEQKHILAFALFDSQIVGTRKPEIVFALDEAYIRKPAADIRNRKVL